MSDTTLPPASIATALVKAQRAAEAVVKGKTAGKGGDSYSYKFASTEAIMQECRGALHSAGLAVLNTGWRLEAQTLWVNFLVAHDGGESWAVTPVPMPCAERKGTPLDKAVAAAVTYATGYFLRGLLQLPRVGEGEELDKRDDSGHEPQRRQPPRQQKPPPAAIKLGAHKGVAWAEATPQQLGTVAEECVVWITANPEADPKQAAAVKWHMEKAQALLLERMEAESNGAAVAGAFGPDNAYGDDVEGDDLPAEGAA